MAFSVEIIQEAWEKSGGSCECKRYEHNHENYRCAAPLTFANRGKGDLKGAWEAHPIDKKDGDSADNCEILCWYCHKLMH